MGRRNPWTDRVQIFCLFIGTQDVITCIKFGDDRLRGFWSAGCQSSPFSHWLWSSSLQQSYATACTVMLRTTVLHCDIGVAETFKFSCVERRCCL